MKEFSYKWEAHCSNAFPSLSLFIASICDTAWRDISSQHTAALLNFMCCSNTSNYGANLSFAFTVLIDWSLCDSQRSRHEGPLAFRPRRGKPHFAFVKERLFCGQATITFPAEDLDRGLNEVSSSLTQLQICLITFRLSRFHNWALTLPTCSTSTNEALPAAHFRCHRNTNNSLLLQRNH